VRVGNQELDDTQSYRIVVSSFVAQGGDHYQSFLNGKNVHDTGELLCDVLAAYAGKLHSLAPPAGDRMVPVGSALTPHPLATNQQWGDGSFALVAQASACAPATWPVCFSDAADDVVPYAMKSRSRWRPVR
jgi:hypothetical protein